MGVCLAQRLHRTRPDGSDVPVVYPSGLAVVAPARYAVELVARARTRADR